MNCHFVDDEQRDDEGRCRVRCVRCERVPKTRSNHPASRYHFPGCTGTPFWWELGAWSEIILGVFGLRRSTYLWFKSRLGLQPQCRCQQRSERLDQLGLKLRDWLLLGLTWAGFIVDERDHAWFSWLLGANQHPPTSQGSLLGERRQELGASDADRGGGLNPDPNIGGRANAGDHDGDRPI